MTILAAIPDFRNIFFRSQYWANHGTVHQVIGYDEKDAPGVRDAHTLKDALVRLLVQGLSLEDVKVGHGSLAHAG